MNRDLAKGDSTVKGEVQQQGIRSRCASIQKSLALNTGYTSVLSQWNGTSPWNVDKHKKGGRGREGSHSTGSGLYRDCCRYAIQQM
jgi:DNA-binding IclR family transcriptional regulator